MKIGVLGGTFDPPHNGHLRVAEACIANLELDEVLFLPANRNPLKNDRNATDPKHRLEMVKRLVQDRGRLAVSDMDLTRGGPSYAVDTLSELSMAQPAEYWFLMGMDALKLLPNWKNPARLIRLCRIGVVGRSSGFGADVLQRLPEELRSHVDVVPMELADISSSDIRDLLAQKRDISRFVPPAVRDYISRTGLYK